MNPATLWHRTAHTVASATAAMLRARVAADDNAFAAAADDLGRAVGESRALAALLGAEWLLHRVGIARQSSRAQYAAAHARPCLFRAIDLAPAAPTFREAVDAILRRTPALADTWAIAAEHYARGGIAFARSANLTVTQKAQQIIARALNDGLSRDDAAADLSAFTGWADSYSQTVFRTVAIGAYTEGQFVAAQTSGRDVVGAFEFSATGDSDTRPNHERANGFIAAIDDPVWDVLRPPLGYNCRCALLPTTHDEVRRRYGREGLPAVSRVPSGAGPDAGFRQSAAPKVRGVFS